LSYALLDPAVRQKKRIFDVVVSVFVVLTALPLGIITKSNPFEILLKAFSVLAGASWVGLAKPNTAQSSDDVALLDRYYNKFGKNKSSVFVPSLVTDAKGALANKVDALYIKEYNQWLDLQYIWLGLSNRTKQ
jgi:hypothetical protein